MRNARRFLNKKENVPDLDENDRETLLAILFGILLVVVIYVAIFL